MTQEELGEEEISEMKKKKAGWKANDLPDESCIAVITHCCCMPFDPTVLPCSNSIASLFSSLPVSHSLLSSVAVFLPWSRLRLVRQIPSPKTCTACLLLSAHTLVLTDPSAPYSRSSPSVFCIIFGHHFNSSLSFSSPLSCAVSLSIPQLLNSVLETQLTLLVQFSIRKGESQASLADFSLHLSHALTTLPAANAMQY